MDKKSNHVNKLVSDTKCTGCYLCESICPESAIRTEQNNEGFIFPVVDETKCSDCGQCVKHCPTNSKETLSNSENFQAKAYWGVDTDAENLKKSSSGGIFGVLANSVLEDGGVVFGAAQNNDLTICHTAVSSTEAIDCLRGSKYLQSKMSGVYEEVSSFLSNGRKVMFSGTPCHVAALNNYIKKKQVPFQNLISCEVICHGVNSERVFSEHKRFLESRFNSKLTSFKFRDKEIAWDKPLYKGTFANGKEYKIRHIADSFGKGFSRDLFLRLSCYRCDFSLMPRKADITLGDYWEAPKVIYNNKGVSVVCVNSSKGEKLFSQILPNIKSGEVDINEISSRKYRLNGDEIPLSGRKRFWRDYEKFGFKYVEVKYLKHLNPPFRWLQKSVNGEYWDIIKKVINKRL